MPTARPAASHRIVGGGGGGGDGVRVFFVVMLGVAVRTACFALAPTHALELLEDRAELVAPSTSIRGLREAAYLASASLVSNTPGPWSSPHVHHPPLVVRTLSPLVMAPLHPPVQLSVFGWTLEARVPSVLQISFILADVLTALALVQIERIRAFFRPGTQPRGLQDLETDLSAKAVVARRQSGLASSGPASKGPTSTATVTSRSALVAALYLLNPIVVLTCLALSSTTLYAPFLAGVVYFATASGAATSGSLYQTSSRLPKQLVTAGLLAVNAVLNVYPVLLLPPICMLATSSCSGAITLGVLALTLAAVLGCSNFLMSGAPGWAGAVQVWRACYAHLVLLSDLAPNVGLWWYFFTEMFDHFRSFFLLTFNAHLALYVAPLSIKFRSDPLFAITLLVGILAVFKPYPTLGDSALFWSLLSLHPEVFPYLRYPIVTALLYAYSLVFLPAFHELWTVTGSGNANFFFASTLILALAGTGGLLDALWAKGRLIHEHTRALVGPPATATDGTDQSETKADTSKVQKGTDGPVLTAYGWTRTIVQI